MGINPKLKKMPNKDWHTADIVAALHKAGWSLRGLSVHHGYSDSSTLKIALQRPYPKAERLICEAIRKDGEHSDIQPEDIWPSRYERRTAKGKAA